MDETRFFVRFVDIFNMDLGSGGRDGPHGLNEPHKMLLSEHLGERRVGASAGGCGQGWTGLLTRTI